MQGFKQTVIKAGQKIRPKVLKRGLLFQPLTIFNKNTFQVIDLKTSLITVLFL
jgi:hypothetical protein